MTGSIPLPSRRAAIRRGAGAILAVAAATDVLACAPPTTSRRLLRLEPPDDHGLMLPAGFRSRVVARSFQPVEGTTYFWHLAPDGGAVFPSERGGWTYVSNSESIPGGVGAIEFAADGRIVAARSLLSGRSLVNCAGGAMPWGTWLSCEEWPFGRVFECDPTGRHDGRVRPALGAFKHEAVAADPEAEVLYLTEDESDGCLYRFTPDTWGDLSRGRLEAAIVDDEQRVSWGEVSNRTPGPGTTPTRLQVAGAARFAGGEGIVHRAGHVYFTTKHDNRVWDLDARAMRLSVLYDGSARANPPLLGVDNITTMGDGLCVAEDGGHMEMVAVGLDGRTATFLRVVGQDRSELTGPAFDPSGTRLYLSSQRGTDGLGITYEISGPFDRLVRTALG